MKTPFIKFLILIVFRLIFTETSAQNSVNVYGNVNNTNNTSNIQACDSGYLAFGNINLLSVQYFDFKEGEKFSMSFKQNLGNGESIVLNVNGKTAAYDWFRNNVAFKTNGTNSLIINNNGKYFAKLRDSSCFYNSDTINVRKIAKPSKPAITKNGQKLTSNALGLNTWFYKNLPIDSNKTEINLMGDGAYFVKSINGSGCFSNSDVFNYNASFIDLISMENKVRVINQNTILYSGNEAVSISLFSLDGKLLSKNIIGENTLKVAFPQGIYLVCVEYNAQKHYLKAMLGN